MTLSSFKTALACITLSMALLCGNTLHAKDGNTLHAKKYCKCPVLKVKDLQNLYESGRTYDSWRGYIPYTEKKVTKKDSESITSITPLHAIRNKDNSCICQYMIKDSAGRKIDKLGLEKL